MLIVLGTSVPLLETTAGGPRTDDVFVEDNRTTRQYSLGIKVDIYERSPEIVCMWSTKLSIFVEDVTELEQEICLDGLPLFKDLQQLISQQLITDVSWR